PLPPPTKKKNAEHVTPAPAELPPIPVDNRNISMRQRRAELRELGLADPSMELFQKEVGAPPPKVEGQQSSGLFKGMFGSSSSLPTTTTEKNPVVTTNRTSPSSTSTEEPMIPKGVPWGQFFARFRQGPGGNEVETRSTPVEGPIIPTAMQQASTPGV